MAENVSSSNIKRYKVGYFSDTDSPFCLAQLANYEAADETESEKVNQLLDGRYDEDATDFTQACNVGKCTMRILRNESVGKRITGDCRAAEFCLKDKFELVRELPIEEGRALYGEIIDTLEGHADSNNAGNYCPKLDCGLSAGVSIDGHAGTAGICRDEATGQCSLPI